MRFRTTSLLLLVVAGCAAEPGSPPAQTASAKAQNCEREYRVGSNIATKNCSPAMTDEERQRMIIDMETMARPGPTKPPGQ